MTGSAPSARPTGYTEACTSCGSPIPEAADHAAGDPGRPWCRHCADERGALQPFEERWSRMVERTVSRDGVDEATAEQRTLAYLRTMPAWRDHPRVIGG